MPERCHSSQGGETPLDRAALTGHEAVIEQLLAAGAAVDAQDKVKRGGGGIGEGWWQNTALRVLLAFVLCASQILDLSSLSGLVRELVT